MSRPYTIDEAREILLNEIHEHVDYWETTTTLNPSTTRERLRGLAFSILNTIDQQYVLVPDPHERDKEYHIRKGENYYHEATIENDLTGELHGEFINMRQ